VTDNININQNVNEITVTQQANNVIISSVGIQGIQGLKGDAGNNGINGGNFTFEQQTNATIWNITHNLGYRPAVTVQDYGKITLEGDLSHTDANSLILTFSQAVSGYAYLS
jgi:hypothetical protein